MFEDGMIAYYMYRLHAAFLYHLKLLSMLALLHYFPVPLDISSIALHKSLNAVGPLT